jgi:hypothetical protein
MALSSLHQFLRDRLVCVCLWEGGETLIPLPLADSVTIYAKTTLYVCIVLQTPHGKATQLSLG